MMGGLTRFGIPQFKTLAAVAGTGQDGIAISDFGSLRRDYKGTGGRKGKTTNVAKTPTCTPNEYRRADYIDATRPQFSMIKPSPYAAMHQNSSQKKPSRTPHKYRRAAYIRKPSPAILDGEALHDEAH